MKDNKDLIRVRMYDFMIHINTRRNFRNLLNFEVYPIHDCIILSTKEECIIYVDKENECAGRKKFEDGKCLKKLEGSYCWRGVWEGRIFFPDYEYWGEEIEKLSRLYNDKIIPWCQDFIINRDLNNNYDDN